jgi:hypothetical protein
MTQYSVDIQANGLWVSVGVYDSVDDAFEKVYELNGARFKVRELLDGEEVDLELAEDLQGPLGAEWMP